MGSDQSRGLDSATLNDGNWPTAEDLGSGPQVLRFLLFGECMAFGDSTMMIC
ncbi:hypothetical protein AWB78_06925 [Caballeronia calidae]|uniref:Uncharacterized protein n=1 Tax=Caballeronia calidae TaxID=1777139 RepID=A0A158EBU6_9BURK|nr:hypothetical protein AWB78_06925 [Caballeronia calidae]